MKFSVDSIMNSKEKSLSRDDYKVWDENPHGTIVRRYEHDGEKFVVVVFDTKPDTEYVYLENDG